MEELKDTIDNGETEVQVAAIGDVVGTGPGGEPVEQHITEEALQKLAEAHKGKEILVDADHESETNLKTEAKGWLSGLKVVPGVGLFGKIKWTDIGRKLIENRVFRFLSPSWWLNENKEPVSLTSVALTNKPAITENKAIINSQPVEKEISLKTKGILDMDKEELAAMIAEIVDARLAEAKKAEAVEEVKEEKIEEETAENACSGEEKAEEAKNEEPDEPEVVVEKVVEEVKEEPEPEVEESETEKEDDSEEVIKIEALNSQPKTAGIDVIRNSAPKTSGVEDLFKGVKITRVV